MPSGSIEEEDGVTALRHLAADLLEMQVHRLRIGTGQDQGCTDIAMRADSAKCRPIRGADPAARVDGCRAGSVASQCALLANPGFVLPPKFNRLFARMLGDGGFDQIGKVFCVSPALPGPAADGAAAPTSAGTRAGTASRQHCARPVSH